MLVNITSGPSLGIREATAATSVIQREAGDDVEVIFGTVIDEEMDDKLRVTVIATGFEDGPQQKEESSRRSVPLDDENSPVHYKGEDNLRQLDTPAYERRTSPLRKGRKQQKPSGEDDGDEDDDSDKTTNIRRLRADDLKNREDREERIRKDDTDTPAFLRKMMD